MYFCHFISLVAFTIVTISLAPPSGDKCPDTCSDTILRWPFDLGHPNLNSTTTKNPQKYSHKVTING
jgi:hypothetical protein